MKHQEARRKPNSADRALLLAFWNRRCGYCRQPLNGEWDVEHLIPLARGGRNTLSNLAPSCGPCNERKGLATAEEFRAPQVPQQAERIVTLVSAFWDGDRVATALAARFGLTDALMTSYLFKPVRLRGLLDE